SCCAESSCTLCTVFLQCSNDHRHLQSFPYTTLFRSLQAAYANLHTDQERDYFMQRYHDVISSFGGKTSYDADNRPLLVMQSNLWASGYDVDVTDQTSLGQFSGRVQQTYNHSVPCLFVPEHGNMFTRALVRFFFFQAKDGIRDKLVTGVQTCALPISISSTMRASRRGRPTASGS